MPTLAFGAHPATPAAMETVFAQPWKKPSTHSTNTQQPTRQTSAAAAASEHDSARFVRRAMAGSAAVPLPLELARYSTPSGLLRTALGTAESCAAAGAAAAAAEAGVRRPRQGGESNYVGEKAAAGGDEDVEEEEEEEDALFPSTQPVHLLLCRVAVAPQSSSGNRHDDDDDDDAAASRGGRAARYDRARDAYYAYDPAAVLPEFVITLNVVPAKNPEEEEDDGFSGLEEEEDEEVRRSRRRSGGIRGMVVPVDTSSASSVARQADAALGRIVGRVVCSFA